MIEHIGLVLWVILIAYVPLLFRTYSDVGLGQSPIDSGFAVVTWFLCVVAAPWMPGGQAPVEYCSEPKPDNAMGFIELSGRIGY